MFPFTTANKALAVLRLVPMSNDRRKYEIDTKQIGEKGKTEIVLAQIMASYHKPHTVRHITTTEVMTSRRGRQERNHKGPVSGTK